MAFTAHLDSISRSGTPGTFDIGLTYADSASGWQLSKTLRVVLDLNQTAPQKLAALQAAVTADATLYKQHLATSNGLSTLTDQTLTI